MPHPEHKPFSQSVTAVAPGKVILSGEHAVLYQAPAVATAVNITASCTAFLSDQPKGLQLTLRNFEQTYTLNWLQVAEIYHRVNDRYRAFERGQLPINDVTDSEIDLIIYAINHAFDLEWSSLSSRLTLDIDSQIPIGSGMGSSAAITAAVLTSVAELLKRALGVPPIREWQPMIHHIENIQHARSSGLDPELICHGGLVSWRDGEAAKITLSRSLARNQWFIVNSGKPQSSTGECVTHVRKHFAESDIWNSFATVTERFIEALSLGDDHSVQQSINENHRLLCTIGVVPKAVETEIQALQSQGFAAKISGAGSIEGDHGGMVLIYSKDGTQPPDMFTQAPQPLCFSAHGVHLDG